MYGCHGSFSHIEPLCAECPYVVTCCEATNILRVYSYGSTVDYHTQKPTPPTTFEPHATPEMEAMLIQDEAEWFLRLCDKRREEGMPRDTAIWTAVHEIKTGQAYKEA
jgi:hypothetical protein